MMLEKLNPEQRAAVTLEPQHALVLAGAGSGKTRVLTTRMAWLIQTGQASPFGLLAVTFTNKAAREMLARMSAILPIDTRGLWIGTFHGLCNRMLRAHHRDAGLPQSFQILDVTDQLAAIKRLMKANGVDDEKYPPRDVQRFINGAKEEGLRPADVEAYDAHRRRLIEIYQLYEAQCQREGVVDFAELLLRAYELLSRNAPVREHYQRRFRHILVDEFQDISQSRARLVKALKAQHPNVRVFAVGDDWQSIFRFAGSDIHLMRQFGREFGGAFDGEAGVHRTVDLGRTFRSVDQIAFAARTFVLRNPAQIQKQIVPAGTATEPAIRLIAVSKGEDEAKLSEVLTAMSAAVAPEAKPATVLLLGRYRFVEPNLRDLRRRFPRLKISFKTIHASKGLEADHVILLNADSGRTGFPSEIVDDPLLSLVSPEEEAFQNAEERRVMYVAMTRARHTLTILASNARPSSFVTELKKDPAYGIVAPPGVELEEHGCGECGGRLLGVTGKDGRIWYRCEHVQHCGNLLPACQSCGTAMPRGTDGTTEVRCACGATYPSCPECEDGWLIERSGSYGKFLGCVRYPTCIGKAKISSGDRSTITKPRRRKRA